MKRQLVFVHGLHLHQTFLFEHCAASYWYSTSSFIMAALVFFKLTTAIFSVAAIYTGAQALFHPAGFAKSFGLSLDSMSAAMPLKTSRSKKEGPTVTSTKPILHPHNPAMSYVSLMGIRQLANGLILATFAYQGKWMEVATILAIIGTLVAGTDGIYLSRAGKTSLGVYHAVPGALIAMYASFVLYHHL